MLDDKHNAQKRLAELSVQIEKMERENNELFQSLGISPKELLSYLNDKDRVPESLYRLIQKNNKQLDEVIARRIEESTAYLKKRDPVAEHKLRGHWIFVR